MKTLEALGSRILKLFLSDVSAGACVPENGRCCSTRNRRFNCYGSCVYSLSC